MILARRSFITGLVGVLAAPAIVRAESLMKVVAPKPIGWWPLFPLEPGQIVEDAIEFRTPIPIGVWRQYIAGSFIGPRGIGPAALEDYSAVDKLLRSA